jgi:acyl carrier protein
MNREETAHRIIACLEDMVPSHITVDRSTDLLKLGINSMTFIRLVVALEEALGIEIDDDSIYLENFRSVNHICDLVEQYAL